MYVPDSVGPDVGQFWADMLLSGMILKKTNTSGRTVLTGV